MVLANGYMGVWDTWRCWLEMCAYTHTHTAVEELTCYSCLKHPIESMEEKDKWCCWLFQRLT